MRNSIAAKSAREDEIARLRSEIVRLQVQLRDLEGPDEDVGGHAFQSAENPAWGATPFAMGSVIIDLRTDSVWWSEDLFLVLGYDSAKDTPNTLAMMAAVHPDDRDKFKEWMNVAIAGVKPGRITFRLLRRDAEMRRVVCDGVVVFDSKGQAERLMAFVMM